jgi:hypothetical protein
MTAENRPSSEPTVPLLTAEQFMEGYGNASPELINGVVRWGVAAGYPSAPSEGQRMTAEEFFERFGNARVELVDGVVQWEPPPPPPATRGFVVLARPASGEGHGILGKVVEHLRAGAAVVIVLDPATRSAMVYRPDAPLKTHHAGDTLTVPDVLPGFAVDVGRLFE